MSEVQLRFTFQMHYFSKCSPLFPIYGNRVQIVGMLFLFTMFFSYFGASLQRLFNKDLRIYLRKPFHDINYSVSSILFWAADFGDSKIEWLNPRRVQLSWHKAVTISILTSMGIFIKYVWHNDFMILYARLRCWITSKYSGIFWKLSCFLGLYANIDKMLIFGHCFVLLFMKFSGRIAFISVRHHCF